MGVYTTATITTDVASDRASSISAWFNALDGISSEVVAYTYNNVEYSGAKITIDDTGIEIFFGFKDGTDLRATEMYVKNGDIFLTHREYTHYNEGEIDNTVSAYLDENCIVLSSAQYGTGFEVVYTKTRDDKYLVGYGYIVGSVTVKFADISTLTFEDTEDSARIPYTYSNMFPFYAKEGTVDFLNQAYFKNGNSLKSFTTDILKECSTVSLLSTISLPSPLNNNIALGAHCIVPLDDEEVDE